MALDSSRAVVAAVRPPKPVPHGARASRLRNSPHQWGATSVVAEARRYIGTNPTRYTSLWCADFINLVLERTGYRGTRSRLARSFASYGTRVAGPQVGSIAVMSRRGPAASSVPGGHVGVGQRCRPERQSDHHLRQPQQARCRGGVSACADLCLRNAQLAQPFRIPDRQRGNPPPTAIGTIRTYIEFARSRHGHGANHR